MKPHTPRKNLKWAPMGPVIALYLCPVPVEMRIDSTGRQYICPLATIHPSPYGIWGGTPQSLCLGGRSFSWSPPSERYASISGIPNLFATRRLYLIRPRNAGI